MADRRSWRWIDMALPALAVALAYYLGALLGFALTFRPRPVSILWPPNAILLAALLLTRERSWWIILLAALPAHLAVELGTGVPWPMVICWFVSNSFEALVGAVGVRHFDSRPLRFDSSRQVGVFVALAGFAGPFLSSFLDAEFVRLNAWGGASYWDVWQTRFFSNVLVALTLAPVIIIWGNLGSAALREAPWRRYGEAALLAVCLLGVSAAVFGGHTLGADRIPALLFAPLPFLLWAAVRFGPAGASLSLVAVVMLAITSTIQGRGPFVIRSAADNAFAIQTLFTIVSITLLFLSAVIQERKRAEDAARQNAEQLQLALDAARMNAWEWELSPGTRQWPDEPAGVLGFTARNPEVAADRLSALVHPDDRTAVSTALLRTFERGDPYDLEFRVLRANGTVRWLLGQGKVLHDGTGRPSRVIGVHVDISERRKAEALMVAQNAVLEMLASGAALSDVLARLVTLVESQCERMLCAIVLLDEDRVHMRVGAASRSPDSFVSAVHGAITDPDSGLFAATMHFREQAVATHSLDEAHRPELHELVTQHGIHSCWSTPITSHPGEVLGFLALFHEEVRGPAVEEDRLIEIVVQLARLAIERARAQQALSESHQRHQLASVAGGVGVWECRLDGGDMYVDPQLGHLLGHGEFEIGNCATDWISLIHADDIESAMPSIRAILAGELAQCEIEHRVMHRDGSFRWFLTRASVLPDADGKPTRVLGTSTDVTARKNVELEAQEQRRVLAHLGRVAMLGELSGSLAHELNQPLGAIMANAAAGLRILAHERPDLGEMREIFQDIVKADQRAGDVIVHLRALIKRDELHLERIDMNELVVETLAFMHSDLIERQVSIDNGLPPSLVVVLGDRVQLQQVLLNLIVNACEAMNGTPRHQRRIALGAAFASDRSVKITVADRGPGIPPEVMDRLLEPFVSTKEHGLGLGLAICHSILVAHGGTVKAQNSDEGGALFTITLPAAG